MSTENVRKEIFSKIFRKTKKHIKIFLLVLVILFVLLTGFAFSPLLPMVAKPMVQKKMAESLKADVKIGDMKINVLGTKVFLGNMEIDNSKATNPYTCKLSELMIDIDLSGFKNDTLVFNNIEIKGLEVLVKKSQKTASLSDVLTYLTHAQKTKEASMNKEQVQKSSFNNFIIKQASLRKSIIMVGDDVEYELPEIVVRDVENVNDLISELIITVSADTIQTYGEKIIDKFKNFLDKF